MESYVIALINNIRKVYIIPPKQSNAYKSLFEKMKALMEGLLLNTVNGDAAIHSFSEILSTLKKLPPKQQSESRSTERISNITNMLNNLDFVPESIIDLGAGSGDITIALKDYYGLSTDKVFAIDQKLPSITEVTALTYVDEKIPLPDNSIYFVVMFVVLHHIPHDIRIDILDEISRILIPGGYVFIREHDDDTTKSFYVFIDLIHIFWYLSSNETADPLYLMTRTETQQLFENAGFQSVGFNKYSDPNPQRLYHELYRKNKQNSISTI